ncbi:hypothetical protein SK128_020168 [Halocaridina rubra]|uniref:Uncharacterized protein n=1 Tax=Halocaridina rubra TaxID=373956 RepID=A0AAN8WNT1_HALRR
METSPGIFSGLKSWVRGRRESRSSSTSTLTSAPRQEPDGAPASSPRKSSDDYNTSATSSQKNSDKNSDKSSENLKPDFRAEIIAASKKRNADTEDYMANSAVKSSYPHKSSYSPRNERAGREVAHNHHHHGRHQEGTYYQSHHQQRVSKSRHRNDPRRSVSPDSQRLSQGMMQELPEFHQARREYREYRSPSSRRSHSPQTRTTNSPPSSITPSKNSSNYRREFCYGNAHVIGPNVVSVKMKRNDESDRYSKHSSDDRRSVGSSGMTPAQRSSSAELLDSASCSSSSTNRQPGRRPTPQNNFADSSLSQNYNRMNGYPPVDSSPARFAHNMLTPFNGSKSYKPVSFTPPPPTKILPVN